jgi:hypothetical protein
MSIPMTSPVERISGPSTTSTPGNLVNGKTLSLTLVWAGRGASVTPRASSDWPAITLAASFAHGTPVALETNGTVREARGLTSSTYTRPSLTAYCTFISPFTASRLANAIVAVFMSATMPALSPYGGRAQAESPE